MVEFYLLLFALIHVVSTQLVMTKVIAKAIHATDHVRSPKLIVQRRRPAKIDRTCCSGYRVLLPLLHAESSLYVVALDLLLGASSKSTDFQGRATPSY